MTNLSQSQSRTKMGRVNGPVPSLWSYLSYDTIYCREMSDKPKSKSKSDKDGKGKRSSALTVELLII